MIEEDWNIAKKRYYVTVGYAPIPEKCLRPMKMDPISLPRKLEKYIKEHGDGAFRDSYHDTAEEALEWMRQFEVPAGSLWFKNVVERMPEGVPDKVVSYTSGIKNKLEHTHR